jgi:uridine kinase
MSGDLSAVLQRIEKLPASRRVLVAIDGIGGSGKSTFAASVAAAIDARPVVLIHADDFFNPIQIRHSRGRLSAEGFWLDTYDYDTLITRTLDPLRTGDGRYWTSNTPATSVPALEIAATDAIVIVEGTFLLRDQLQHYWDLSVFLDVSFETAAGRMVGRGTVEAATDPRLDRWFGAQRLYFDHARPWERASLVIDNNGPPTLAGSAPHAASTVPLREEAADRD